MYKFVERIHGEFSLILLCKTESWHKVDLKSIFGSYFFLPSGASFLLLLTTQEIIIKALLKNMYTFKNLRPICIGKPNISPALRKIDFI